MISPNFFRPFALLLAIFLVAQSVTYANVATPKKDPFSIRPVDDSVTEIDLKAGVVPEGTDVMQLSSDETLIAVVRDGGISGEHIVYVQASQDIYTSEFVITLKFDKVGSRKLSEITTANLGRPLAIVLDGKVISAPRILEPITGGSVRISGGFSRDEAEQMALMLQASVPSIAAQAGEEPK